MSVDVVSLVSTSLPSGVIIGNSLLSLSEEDTVFSGLVDFSCVCDLSEVVVLGAVGLLLCDVVEGSSDVVSDSGKGTSGSSKEA